MAVYDNSSKISVMRRYWKTPDNLGSEIVFCNFSAEIQWYGSALKIKPKYSKGNLNHPLIKKKLNNNNNKKPQTWKLSNQLNSLASYFVNAVRYLKDSIVQSFSCLPWKMYSEDRAIKVWLNFLN